MISKTPQTSKLPSGIPYIIGNEAAERFSYYGMKAILVVFMTDYLRMSDNHATDWLHSFGSAVYAFPIIGALVSDIFFGKYRTILSLSIVYCLGHLVLALYETQAGLAAGLTLIAIGSGGIKPCVSAHVGDQFTKENQHLLERVFSFFYLSINMGAFVSTLATPLLLKYYGPSLAFGIPGALMMIATFLFWLGRKEFIHIQPFKSDFIATIRSKEGLQAIGKLAILYVFVSVFWSLFDQTASTWIIQSKSDLMNKEISLFGFDFELLPSQIQAANPLLVLLLVPVFTFFIYPFVNKLFPFRSMRKIAIGMFVAAFSFVIVGWVEGYIYQGIEKSIMWQFIAYFVLTAAEVMVSITALEFSYTQAPNQMKSFIMGLYLLSVSLGNFITVGVNSWMQESATNTELISGETTYIHLDKKANVGDKIGIESLKSGLAVISPNDTLDIAGTYIIGKYDDKIGANELWDIHRKTVATLKSNNSYILEFSTYKLNGSTYFYFFALLLGGTAFLFVFYGWNYKEKTYIQDSSFVE